MSSGGGPMSRNRAGLGYMYMGWEPPVDRQTHTNENIILLQLYSRAVTRNTEYTVARSFMFKKCSVTVSSPLYC